MRFDNLTWRCDICHMTRPDEVIGVHKVDIGPKEYPGIVVRNVKYCLDSPACLEGAKNWQEPRTRVSMFKVSGAARPTAWQRLKKLVSGR